jgi:hypothetical protein
MGSNLKPFFISKDVMSGADMILYEMVPRNA